MSSRIRGDHIPVVLERLGDPSPGEGVVQKPMVCDK
jgi:hypothetical protein